MAAREAPEPTNMAAAVFVPLVSTEKAGEETAEVIVTAPPLFDNVMPEPATKFRRACEALFVPFVWKTGKEG